MIQLFDWSAGLLVGIPATAGLAAVALIGYLFGRRTPQSPPVTLPSVGPRELHRAARVARQLQDAIDELRQQLAEHRTYVDRFKTRIEEAADIDKHAALDLLSEESELVILPTLQLASRLSTAYDQFRKQSQVLSNFTEGRTDPLTGLGNASAFEEQMELSLADYNQTGTPSSVAMINVADPDDMAPGSDEHRDFVKRLATDIERCAREHDFVARLGGVEFAVLMPKTNLTGARAFGSRFREQLRKNRSLTADCGIAEALSADTPQAWLSRADSALYSARATGKGAQFLHTGESLQRDNQPLDWSHSDSNGQVVATEA